MNFLIASAAAGIESIENPEEKKLQSDAVAQLMDLRRSFYRLLSSSNIGAAQNLLDNRIITLARSAADVCPTAQASSTCEGITHPSAASLFKDDMSFSSLSSDEMLSEVEEVQPTLTGSKSGSRKAATLTPAPAPAPAPAPVAGQSSDNATGESLASRKKKTARKADQQQLQQRQENASKQDSASSRRRKRGKTPKVEWWHSVTELDPITVEPIAELPYPPFEIKVPVENGTPVSHYFDGKTLAHYIVSTGNFSNPNNRQALDRKVLQALDTYLAANRLPAAKVVEAYDLSKFIKVKQNDRGAIGRAEQIRRDATVMMQSLFNFAPERQEAIGQPEGGRQRRNGRNANNDARRQEQRQELRQEQRQEQFGNPRLHNNVVHNEGNLRVIDANEWHAVEESTLEDMEEFPAMPTSSGGGHVEMPDFPALVAERRAAATSRAGAGPAVGVPKVVEQVAPPSWLGRGQATGPPPSTSSAQTFPTLATVTGGSSAFGTRATPTPAPAPAPGSTAPSWRAVNLTQSMRDASAAFAASEAARPRMMLQPRSKPLTAHTVLPMQTLASPLANDLLCPYSRRTVKLARECGLNFVLQIERDLRTFCLGAGRTMALPSMTRQQRFLVHLLAGDYYGLQTVSRDPEPHRHTVAMKLPNAGPPELTVAEAIASFDSLMELAKETDQEYSGAGVSTSCIGLWDIHQQGGGRISVSQIEGEFETMCRKSAITTHILNQSNVILEFDNHPAARSVLAKLRQMGGNTLGTLSWKASQWWPVPVEWARYQLEMLDRAEREKNKVDKVRGRLLAGARSLQEKRHVNRATGWDDDGSEAAPLPQKSLSSKASRGPPAATQRDNPKQAKVSNMWAALGDDDDDDE